MRAQKVNFLLSYDLESVFDELSDEDAGKLIKAIFDYETKKIVPDFPKQSLLYFAFFTNVKVQMDKNSAAYEDKCEKRREAGKLGGRPLKTKKTKRLNEKAKKPNGYFEKQKNQMGPDSDCDCDCDCDLDNKTAKPAVLLAPARKEPPPVKSDQAEVIAAYQNNFRPIATVLEKDMLVDLLRDFPADWILAAIKETVACGGGRNVKYLTAILERWRAHGGIDIRRKGEKDAQSDIGPPIGDVIV